MDEPLLTATILCLVVVVSEWLVRVTVLRHVGTALLVIIVGAVASNIGLIPTETVPVYDGVFAYVAPLAIFWLLLPVNLRSVMQAGVPLLAMFVVGSAGTVAGVLAAMMLLGHDAFGDSSSAMAGMYAATYTGGSANFNALALHYGIVKTGPLYAGAMAVDSGLTAVWMAATIAIPRLVGRGQAPPAQVVSPPQDVAVERVLEEAQPVAPLDVAVLSALGLGSLWLAHACAQWLAAAGLSVPPILILTVFALGLAQSSKLSRLPGAPVLGMLAVYVFLAAIGALCDVGALASLGPVGLRLAVLASITIGVHAALTFGVARLFGIDIAVASIASQANVGGGTTALALARSLGRADLVLPAILVGSVGTALGTFLGFLVAEQLVA